MSVMTQLEADGSCLSDQVQQPACEVGKVLWIVSVVLTLTSDSYVLTVGTTLSSHNHPLLAQARPRSLSLSAPGLRRAAPGLTPPRVRGIARVRD